jgi:DNA-binding transcriptional ArsR family regulator
MRIEPNISNIGALIGEPSRAAILTALLDGRALPASELALVAGVAPTAASGHLAKLLAGKLLIVEVEGRHRYYRLTGPEVATALESLAQLTATPAVLAVRDLSPSARAIRYARSCYDHLAGELGVAITAELEKRRLILRGKNRAYKLGRAGKHWFAGQGIDVDSLRPGRHGIARQCLDWTERRPHLAGALGAALLSNWIDRGWLKRSNSLPRLIEITPLGRRKLRESLGSGVFLDFGRGHSKVSR